MFNNEIQTYLAYTFILSFGILHGANDLLLLRIKSNKNGFNLNYYNVLGSYVLVVLAILIIFFNFSSLALLLFVLVSAYHFGEQHFKKLEFHNNVLQILFYLLYGLVILFMLFYLNSNKVILIFDDLTNIKFSTSLLKSILITVAFLFFGTLVYLKIHSKIKIFEELFYLLVLLVVFKTAGLLWGFCIYFILWHSIPSINDQMNFLYGKSTKHEFIRYIKSSWVYWLVSIIGLFFLYLTFKENTAYLTSILIYFLAAITFPHVIVMSKLEKD